MQRDATEDSRGHAPSTECNPHSPPKAEDLLHVSDGITVEPAVEEVMTAT